MDKDLGDLLASVVTGDKAENYIGKKVYGRAGTPQETETGTVMSTSRCTLVGCGMARLHVLWSGGVRTYPCVKGCNLREDGDLQIK